jgi:hypothetical protein
LQEFLQRHDSLADEDILADGILVFDSDTKRVGSSSRSRGRERSRERDRLINLPLSSLASTWLYWGLITPPRRDRIAKEI